MNLTGSGGWPPGCTAATSTTGVSRFWPISTESPSSYAHAAATAPVQMAAPTRCPEHRCVLLPPAPDGGTAAGVPAAGRGYASTVRAARSAVGAAAAPPVDGAAVRRETRRRLPVAAARVGGSVA